MSSGSTNKQPLLMDRGLLAIEATAGTSSPVGSVDPGSGTAAKMLVDATSNDGALLESVRLIQRVSGDTTPINFYLSRSATTLESAFFLGQATIVGGGDPGATAELDLPKILAPIPHAGGNNAVSDAIPQFRGLRLAKGWALWCAAASATPVASAPLVMATGGFY